VKLTLKGTVRGISPTDTTDFTNGTQVVKLWTTDSEYRGSALEFPLVPREETRELGALYGASGAVTITIEAGEDNAAYLPEIETRLRASAAAFGPDHYEAAWLTRAADSVRRVWEGPPTTPIDEVAALPILAPPLVDGRPSCCVSASRHDVSLTTMGAGWVIHARNVIEARFCPFCGAKLPEVTP
jgi:hypothetical protein